MTHPFVEAAELQQPRRGQQQILSMHHQHMRPVLLLVTYRPVHLASLGCITLWLLSAGFSFWYAICDYVDRQGATCDVLQWGTCTGAHPEQQCHSRDGLPSASACMVTAQPLRLLASSTYVLVASVVNSTSAHSVATQQAAELRVW